MERAKPSVLQNTAVSIKARDLPRSLPGAGATENQELRTNHQEPRTKKSKREPRASPELSLLEPSFQSAAVFLQQKRPHAEAFADDAMRLGIARGARDPLLAHLVLRGGEPFLGQHLDQPGVQIENEQANAGSSFDIAL